MRPIIFKIDQFEIIDFSSCESEQLVQFYLQNKAHFKDSMPLKDALFYTPQYWDEQLQQYAQAFADGRTRRFVIKDQIRIIGSITYDQISYGCFYACYLGYNLDEQYQGKGIMTRSLRLTIEAVRNELKLNRIMANYMPQNLKSGRILQTLGFEKEGYAKRYLKINGEWQDHILTSLVTVA